MQGLDTPVAIIRRVAPLAALLLALLLVLAACVAEHRPEGCADPSVTIDLTLTASSLTPQNPSACRDQDVTLVVTSEADGVLHIHGYDEEVPATTVSSGQDVTLEFQATRSGQFPIEIHTDDHPEGVGIGIFTVYEP
jgi:hypothetical protein